jgi:hypothetical protein
MSARIKRAFGPLALTNVLTTNVYNNASPLIFDVFKMLHLVNKTAAPVTVSLWLGATGANAAGTELFNGLSIAANSTYDWYCNLQMLSTDFLVGGASANAALAITGMSEQLVVGT